MALTISSIAKKRDYYDVFSIVSFNNTERKKNYYKKNGNKIIGHFCYRNILPNNMMKHIKVSVGTNSNRWIYNYRYGPIVEFMFDIFNYHHICLTIVETTNVVKYQNIRSLASLIPIMREYLELAVDLFNNSCDLTEREVMSEMTIYDKLGHLREYTSLYEMSADELIRIIFIAIDSLYLRIHVDDHPSYN